MVFLFDIFEEYILETRLLLILLNLRRSADLEGCIKLINKKEKNITFFEIPEINLDNFKY